jgi:biotin transport system substrate-specific component
MAHATDSPIERAGAHLSALWLRLLGVPTSALLIALGAHIAIPVDPYGVPITLQTLAVVLTALCLGPRFGSLGILVYVLAGAIGAPVFSGGQAGPQVILGITGGYILGFLLCQPLVTAFIRRRDGSIRGWGALILGTLLGHLAIFAVGLPWLYLVLNSDPDTAATWLGSGAKLWGPIPADGVLYGGFIRYLPGMLLKCAIAVIIGRWACPWAMRRIW